MAGKHLSEDEIKYVISADSSKAQQELHELSKVTKNLRREEKARRSAMIELEATGQKNSEQYQKLKEECRDYTRQIKDNEEKMRKLRSSLDVNAMTMNQLRKYAKELSSELNNTSKAASPKQYAELELRLKGVQARMEELRISAKSYKEIMVNQSTINYLTGNMLTKGAELLGSTFQKVVDRISDTISKSVELAESADGIIHAFNKIGDQDYLQKLREATKGTVSDIELMKAAVRARDFNIPLEDLGKYLSFAQLKAQQTGQEFSYMTESIILGLGRRSVQILDNLGLSMTDIRDKTKETGDFMRGVSAVVDNQLAQAGETYISSADRAAQRTVALEKAQLQLGEALLPLKEEFTDVYGQIQVETINAIKYLVEHRNTLFAFAKGVGLLIATYVTYVNAQKLAYLWSLRSVAVSKLKAAAVAVENTMLELSVLRHAVLNKTMTRSIALQKAFNIVLKLSPWGMVLGGITLVVGALLMFNKRTDAATIAQKKLNDIKKEAVSRSAEELGKIQLLIAAAKDETLSLGKRQKAVTELNRIIPDYNAKLDQTSGKYRANKAALDAYLTSLVKKYEIEGAKKMFVELGEQIAEATHQLDNANAKLANAKKAGSGYTYTTSWGMVGNTSADMVSHAQSEVAALTKKIKNLKAQEKVLMSGNLGKMVKEEAVAGLSDNSKQGTVGAMLDDITQKIDALKSKRLTIKVGDVGALKKVDAQIALLEKRKAELEGSASKGNTVNNGGTKTKRSSSPDSSASRFSHDRGQDLEEAKRAYQDDLAALKQALAEKRLTNEQYNAYAVALNIQHQNNLLAIETSYQERSQTLAITDAAKKKALQEQQDKAVADQRQAAANAYIEGEKQYYDALDRLRATAPTGPQTLRQECDAKLLILDGYYQASLQLAKDDGERQTQVTQAYEAAKASIIADFARKAEEEKARVRQEYGLDTFEDQYAARAAKIKASYDEELLDKQQYDQAMANLDRQAEDHRLQIRQQYGLASQRELYNAELEQLKMHLQNKEISEEKYEEAVKNLKMSKMKEAFDYYANLSGGAVQALQQAEEANVDAKYDAEIEAAKNAGKDTTEIEKKKANEKLKIQKKYADVNFAIKASQIIADTSVSIMKALGELGPIAGPIAATLMGITGAAQLAAANAERQKVKKMSLNGGGAAGASGARVATGLESGGSIDIEREQDGRRFHAAYDPMKRGFVNKPTVIVGEGGFGHSREWVASNAAVENPTVAPIIDIIDRAQRAGTIRTLDMGKFLLQQTQGRQSGGFIPSAPVQAPPPASAADPVLKKMVEVLERLSTEGIPASVALDELEQKQMLRDQARRIGSK